MGGVITIATTAFSPCLAGELPWFSGYRGEREGRKGEGRRQRCVGRFGLGAVS